MFGDKRDEKGQLLGFSICPICEDISAEALKKFDRSSVFKELKNIFPEELILLLFKKLFFEKMFKTACKILINKNENISKKIIYTDFPFINLLQNNKNFENFKFVQKNDTKISTKIKNYFWTRYDLLNYLSNIIGFFFQKNKINAESKIKIAVNFQEILDLENKSDFFGTTKKKFSIEF